MLALGVAVLVAVDVLILLIYTAVEGSRNALDADRFSSKENPMTVEGVIAISIPIYT